MSYNFGEKKGLSAVEVSRRERAERAEKKKVNDSQRCIRRGFFKHITARKCLEEIRAGWDSAFTALYPDPASLQKLKLTPAEAALPPATVTFHLTRQLLFFHHKKLLYPQSAGITKASGLLEDRRRLVSLCRLVSASATRSFPPSDNYCFLSCDPAKGDTWAVCTKQLLSLVATDLDLVVNAESVSRVEYGIYMKFLLDIVDVRKWSYIRIKGKTRSEYSAQEETVIAGLVKAATSICGAFQRHLAVNSALFAVQQRFLDRHVNPIQHDADGAPKRCLPPTTEDVLVTATLRLTNTVVKDNETRLLQTKSLLNTPFLALKLPQKSLQAWFDNDDHWGAVLAVIKQAVEKKGKEFWGEHKYLIGNFVEVGSASLLGWRGAKGDAKTKRSTAWLQGVFDVIQLLPSFTNIKKSLDAEPQLDTQLSVLWCTEAINVLFAPLLSPEAEDTLHTPKGGSEHASREELLRLAASGPQLHEVPKAVRQKPAEKLGFFAKIRKFAKGTEPELPQIAPDAGRVQPKGYSRAPPSGTSLKSMMKTWRPPSWMEGCNLYILLIHKWSSRTVLSALAARAFLVTALWRYLEEHTAIMNELVRNGVAEGGMTHEMHDCFCNILLLFVHCYGHFLPVCDDHEFYNLQQPFSIDTVTTIVTLLSKLAFRLTWQTLDSSTPAHRQDMVSKLKTQSRSVLLLLSDRNVRKKFCEKECWTIEAFRKSLGFKFNPANESVESEVDPRVKAVVNDMPFLISFADRAMYLRKLIEKDRTAHNMSLVKYGITIRRDFLFEDGMDQMAKLIGTGVPGAEPRGSSGVSRLKARFHVQFKNAQGLEEAGIDAGGVFKEFIEALATKGFNPDLGLFKTTEDNKIYPNAESKRLYSGKEARDLYEFLGRVVAKAIYEGVVLNVPFAEFFLNTMLGRANFVEDLKALDPMFHKNLMGLKEIDNVEDLCLTFSYEEERMGKTVAVNLIPHGYVELFL